MSHKNMLCLCFALLLLLFCHLYATAQTSRKEVEQLLTNGDKREWLFKEFRKTLSISCVGEWQRYTFFQDGRLERKRCQEGEVVIEDFSWKLIPVKNGMPGEWQLEFSEPIVFNENDSVQQVRCDLPLGQLNKAGQQMIWQIVPTAGFFTRIHLTSLN